MIGKSFQRLSKNSYASYEDAEGRDIENYFEQVWSNYAPYRNDFSYYQTLVDRLKSLSAVKLMPLYELASSNCRAHDKINIGLRHDIDADPVTGLRAARYLAKKGICGSFYLLHTAPYYGDFHHGVFVRTPQLAKWVLGYIVAGCEIGMHVDALGVFSRGIDGLQSFRRELVWLRSQGAVIRGVTAHNCAPVYGAENYEIFSSYQLWNRTVSVAGYKKIPLGQLSMKELDLVYEGTFAQPKMRFSKHDAEKFCNDKASANIRSREWMKRYLMQNPCCDWQTDYQMWLLGQDQWVIAGRFGKQEVFEWSIGMDRLLEVIQTFPQGSRSVVVLHPEYVAGSK